MADPSWQGVDEYLCSKLLAADPVLDAALASSNEAGLPPIAVAPNQGKLLHLLVLSIGATSVLEIGTLGGYSTTWMARALPDSGRLVTLEFEPKHAAVARANLERAGLAGRVEIRVGRALDSLAQLAEEKAGPFDFVFIDADKENTAAYFDRSVELSHPGSLIFVDNVVRNGAVADASSTDAQVLGMRAFLDAAAEDARVEVTAVQTVGSKGYDGFALARVNPR